MLLLILKAMRFSTLPPADQGAEFEMRQVAVDARFKVGGSMGLMEGSAGPPLHQL